MEFNGEHFLIDGEPVRTTVEIDHGEKTKRGGSDAVDERRENCDAFVIIQNFVGISNQWLFGLFEGDGGAGHNISHSVKRSLPQTMNSIIKTNQKFVEDKPSKVNGCFKYKGSETKEQVLRKAFEMTHR